MGGVTSPGLTCTGYLQYSSSSSLTLIELLLVEVTATNNRGESLSDVVNLLRFASSLSFVFSERILRLSATFLDFFFIISVFTFANPRVINGSLFVTTTF